MQRACQIEIPQKTQVQLVNYKMFLSKQTNLNYYKLLVSKRLIAMLSLSLSVSLKYIYTILCRKPLSLTLSLSVSLSHSRCAVWPVLRTQQRARFSIQLIVYGCVSLSLCLCVSVSACAYRIYNISIVCMCVVS